MLNKIKYYPKSYDKICINPKYKIHLIDMTKILILNHII